ncbi:adenine nucleotide alpha hydrolases-like protein [Tuber magnatum]|uniref:Diphthine--ammonia ligase n=1 Tax=Tuber magnatum TaxID=42249 RepID=A0A317ST33_9PEZI|nr:adenine nucleotide alpha hydrolases-like protein [Tuber magnatum]
MQVIALISGGKDSFFSLLHTIANGHEIVALANLRPPTTSASDPITTHLPSTAPSTLLPSALGTKDELDSFMYQTVGHTVLPLYPHALKIPLYRGAITGTSVDQNLSYARSGKGGDETEDLVPLLEHIIAQHPGVKAVCTGAILSTYQRTRVESVCERLGLISLSYLWQREQAEILADMEAVGLDARIVKVAAAGLDPEEWLWENVAEARRRRMLDGLGRKWGALSTLLAAHGASFKHITTCTLLLRQMYHFPLINSTYSTYFTTPLPPSRICISVGGLLPPGVNIMLSVTADISSSSLQLRRGLHVQSRSYWAPANIGPYSQSITSSGGWTSLAGMIPLVPASMELLNNAETREEVVDQAVLGLQHMWRVARAAEVAGFLGCVAFVTRCEVVGPAVEAWKGVWKGWRGEVGWKRLWSPSSQSPPGMEQDDEDEEEEEEAGFTPPLIITQTSSLPRSSTSEWAGTGIDGPWLHKLQTTYNSTLSPPSSSLPRLHVTPQGTTYGPNAPHSPAGGLQMFCLPTSSPSALALEIKRRISVEQVEAGNVTVYVSAGVASVGEFDTACVECVGDAVDAGFMTGEQVAVAIYVVVITGNHLALR